MNSENGEKRKLTEKERMLLPSGGYEKLKVYQLATLVHDITSRFVELYIPAGSRTRDQMEQAARSGKQNIAEGSVDAATSTKLEINLYNVARGSLEELKIDYLDYLRQHDAIIWDKNHFACKKFISMQISTKTQFKEFVSWAESLMQNSVHYRSLPLKSVIVANAVVLLINVISFWLKKLIVKKLEQFVDNGGFSEHLYHIRSEKRKSGKNGNTN